MKSLATRIYDQVYAACERRGLITKLRKTLKKSKTELIDHENIDTQGLHTLDAVRCVLDKNRSLIFLEEIDKVTKKDSIVFEAGAGAGILSFLPAAKGATVYGVELARETHALANEIKKDLESTNVIQPGRLHFIYGNALQYKIPKKVDLIISENIYTGMFYEKQVEIVNHSLDFLKKNGVVIPAAMRSYVYLAESSFGRSVKHKQEIVPAPDKNFLIPSKQLSKSTLYDAIDFRHPSGPGVNISLQLPITANGTANSLIIYSEITMPSGQIIGRNDTTFLNGDIHIALKPALTVNKGETIHLNLAYQYGSNPNDMALTVRLL